MDFPVSSLVPPAFEKPLSDQAIIEKSKTVLDVIVKGDPKPAIKWFKDDKQITSSKKIQITETSLTILSTTLDDAGVYKIVAENEAGSSFSTASLDVTNAPVFIGDLLPKTAMAIENQPYSLQVQAQGIPPPDVVFFKDDDEIKGSDTLAIQKTDKSHSLLFKNATTTDKGTYKVVASNTAGQVEAECLLDVMTSPVIVRGLKDQTVRLHEDLELSIEIQGESKAVAIWKFNDKDVTEFKNVELKSEGQMHSLFIKTIEVAQEGTYEVTVSNDAGVYTSTAQVFVQGE